MLRGRTSTAGRFRWGIGTGALLLVATLVVPGAQAHIGTEVNGALTDKVRRAQLIFTGTVSKVEYRNSVAARGTAGGSRQIDGSDLPHTFVTFRLEKIHKGRVAGNQLTLRFLGGVDNKPSTDVDDAGNPVPDVYLDSTAPLFDVGDRDLLFVEGNGVRSCPLVGCADGRVRLLSRDPRSQERYAFSDRGDQYRSVDGNIIVGPPQELPDVVTNTLGPFTLSRVAETAAPDGDELGDETLVEETVIGTELTEQQFTQLVQRAIAASHSTRELRALKPVLSANPNVPIVLRPTRPVAPQESSEPPVRISRPWLDELPEEQRAAILEADRREEEAFRANGGNPVF